MTAQARAGRLRRALGDTARVFGWRRIAVTLLVFVAAVLIGRYSWQTRLAVEVEHALYDVRAYVLAPKVEQDDRIVLVTYDDAVLEKTGRRSPLDRGLLARVLPKLDAMGARAIGIDILIDQAQPEDDQLKAALRGMHTPTYLAFANARTNAASVKDWQEQFQDRFLADVSPHAQAASVRLRPDLDGVMRSWPDRPAGDPPILADRMAPATTANFPSYSAIAFREPANADVPMFSKLTIDTFDNPFAARLLEGQVRGRYVLIGGDINDTDLFDTPVTRLTGVQNIGLEIHAALLAQKLDGRPATPLPHWALWAASLAIVAIAAVSAFGELGIWSGLLLALEALAVVLVPLALQRVGVDGQTIPAFGWLAAGGLSWAAATAVARGVGSDQRRFAQMALGRYLPPEIAKAILKDPNRLTLTGERRHIHALFSDIEGFTTLTHAIAAEEMAVLLNAYLDRMSAIVLQHGGTIDKFVGDAVVAFWGAPIAKADDAEQSLRAAIAIAEAGDQFSAQALAAGAQLGRTRVGVHCGEAIIGNFGGEGRIQYTALGDVMNTAARLEGANKSMKTRVLASEAAVRGVDGLDMRPMGSVLVRGRPEPITVYELAPTCGPECSAEITRALALARAGDAEGLAALEKLSASRPDDAALANLVYRIKVTGAGAGYGLE